MCDQGRFLGFDVSAGGGGGSFLFRCTFASLGKDCTLLVAAGGGGGAANALGAGVAGAIHNSHSIISYIAMCTRMAVFIRCEL